MDPTLLTLLIASGLLVVLAVFMGVVLGWANKALHVPVDERIVRVGANLPGANCGGCNFAGCNDFAEAVVSGKAKVTGCTVGGDATAQKVAAVMNVVVEKSWPVRPIVHCAATIEQRLVRGRYVGEATCHAANLVNGIQGCTYGCLGFGDCTGACAFEAILIRDGLAVVDYVRCTGCGACAVICPRNIISLVPFKADRILAVTCANKDFGKDVSSICTVGCIGCSACSKKTPVIRMDGTLPVIAYETYDPAQAESFLAAIDKCSREGLVFVGKPSAKDFAAAAGKDLPARVEADFKTTADDEEWRG